MSKYLDKKKKNKWEEWFIAKQPYFLIAFVVLFLAAVVASSLYFSKYFLPEPVSDVGKAVSPLFTTTTVITGIAFFLTQILLFFFAFRYRKRAGKTAKFFKNYYRLEIFWILVPAVTFLVLFLWGQVVWAKIQTEPNGDLLVIDVMGEQFNWWIRYPGKDDKLGRRDFRYVADSNEMGIDYTDPHSQDDFIPVQMHVPINRPVKLLLHSKDVIHSFFIPHLRVKMDALPGMTTKTYFTATLTTAEMRKKLRDPNFNYEVACAELCGRMHFAMKMILVVDSQQDYEKWVSKQKAWIPAHSVTAKLKE